MPWLADRFTLPLRSESWTLAQMELPSQASQVSNTLWGHRVAKSAKVCKAASNQSLKRFYPDLSRAVVLFVVCLFQNLPQLSSISSLSVKGTPAAQEKNGGPSTCLEASPSKCDKCDAAIFAVPFTACIFQMDFGFCFNFIDIWCCTFVAPEAVWQPHVTVAHHGLFQSLKAKLCPT